MKVHNRRGTVDSDIVVVTKRFSGGEVQVKLNGVVSESVFVETLIKNSDDLMELLLVTDALKQGGAKTIRLKLPYLPYSRQDRVCAPGEAFSLKVLANILNAQEYASVVTYDAHSSVSTQLVNNLVNIELSSFLNEDELKLYANVDVVVAPDAGACRRAESVGKKLGVPCVHFDKVRNSLGDVTYAPRQIEHDELTGKVVLVVDDICDGGRTFCALGETVLKQNPKSLLLLVTNGIFSHGKEHLKQYYNEVRSVVQWD